MNTQKWIETLQLTTQIISIILLVFSLVAAIATIYTAIAVKRIKDHLIQPFGNINNENEQSFNYNNPFNKVLELLQTMVVSEERASDATKSLSSEITRTTKINADYTNKALEIQIDGMKRIIEKQDEIIKLLSSQKEATKTVDNITSKEQQKVLTKITKSQIQDKTT